MLLLMLHYVTCVSELKLNTKDQQDYYNLSRYRNVNEDLTYSEYPVRILETSRRITRSKAINMCKVQWSHHSKDEATWEREDELRAEFPQLFSEVS
jgi:hypothetical protein